MVTTDITTSIPPAEPTVQEIGDVQFELSTGPKIRMSGNIKRMFGCKGCEWSKDKNFCPHPGKTKPTVGICDKRARMLASFVQDKEGLDVVQVRDFTLSVLDTYSALQFMRDQHKFIKGQDELDELEDRFEVLTADVNTDEESVKRIKLQIKSKKKDLKDLRSNWSEMLETMKKYDEMYRKRTTTKKVEVTNVSVKPSDVAKLLRDSEKEIIDGEVLE